MSAPSLELNRPSPPSDIMEEDEALMMELDLDDILEASILGGADVEVVIHESEGETDADATQTEGLDFSRWDRVPIGAFRSSRSTRDIQPHSANALQAGPFTNGNAAVYLPIATAILNAAQHSVPAWQTSNGNKRVKITRRDAIALSPMLMPILTSRVPSTIKSRKDRRAERKRAISQSPATVRGEPSARSSTLAGSPAPDLAIPAFSLDRSSHSPGPDLPPPTLPSSSITGLSHSPLFSAQAHAAGIPAFSLDPHQNSIFRM